MEVRFTRKVKARMKEKKEIPTPFFFFLCVCFIMFFEVTNKSRSSHRA